MTKWILIVLAVIVALAVVGFILDVAKALAGVAIVVLLGVAAFQLIFRRKRTG